MSDLLNYVPERLAGQACFHGCFPICDDCLKSRFRVVQWRTEHICIHDVLRIYVEVRVTFMA